MSNLKIHFKDPKESKKQNNKLILKENFGTIKKSVLWFSKKGMDKNVLNYF